MIDFYIGPFAAKIDQAGDFFNKLDPFLQLSVAGASKRTKTLDSGGQTPVWTDVFHFRGSSDDVLRAKIFDEDILLDDCIGEVEVPLRKVIASKGKFIETLYFSNRNNSGSLTIQALFLDHKHHSEKEKFYKSKTLFSNLPQSKKDELLRQSSRVKMNSEKKVKTKQGQLNPFLFASGMGQSTAITPKNKWLMDPVRLKSLFDLPPNFEIFAARDGEGYGD